MTNQHPITPPAGLVDKWSEEWHRSEDDNTSFEAWMLARAAQWGADQELEACCEWVGCMFHGHKTWSDELRAARRPKPPSLKERALIGLSRIESTGEFFSDGMKDLDTIRRALEVMPE